MEARHRSLADHSMWPVLSVIYHLHRKLGRLGSVPIVGLDGLQLAVKTHFKYSISIKIHTCNLNLLIPWDSEAKAKFSYLV